MSHCGSSSRDGGNRTAEPLLFLLPCRYFNSRPSSLQVPTCSIHASPSSSFLFPWLESESPTHLVLGDSLSSVMHYKCLPSVNGAFFVNGLRDSVCNIGIFQPVLYLQRYRSYTGELTYLEALGQPILVLNSARACRDLLDKRSSIDSDRPRMVSLFGSPSNTMIPDHTWKSAGNG